MSPHEPNYKMDITQPAEVTPRLVKKFSGKRWAGTETEFIDAVRGDFGHLLFVRDSYHRGQLFERHQILIWYGSDGRLRIVDMANTKPPKTNWGRAQCSWCVISQFTGNADKHYGHTGE